MTKVRILFIVIAIFIVVGIAISYVSKKDEIASAQQTVAQDQTTLSTDQNMLQQEIRLKRSYVTLARVYLKDRPTVEKIEEKFNVLLAQESRQRNVRFSGAEFGSINGSVPTPSPTGFPGQQGYIPQVQPTPITTSRKSPTDIIGGRLPGDPNVGRPSIDPTLFVRIPVAVRIDGRWKDVIATVDDLSRSDVMMTVMNPEVQDGGKSDVEIHLSINLLDPAMPLVPGFENEVQQSLPPIAPPARQKNHKVGARK